MPIVDEQNRTDESVSERLSSGTGDFRGAYGYGRPAHKADPAAEYGFDAGPLRVAGSAPGPERVAHGPKPL